MDTGRGRQRGSPRGEADIDKADVGHNRTAGYAVAINSEKVTGGDRAATHINLAAAHIPDSGRRTTGPAHDNDRVTAACADRSESYLIGRKERRPVGENQAVAERPTGTDRNRSHIGQQRATSHTAAINPEYITGRRPAANGDRLTACVPDAAGRHQGGVAAAAQTDRDWRHTKHLAPVANYQAVAEGAVGPDHHRGEIRQQPTTDRQHVARRQPGAHGQVRTADVPGATGRHQGGVAASTKPDRDRCRVKDFAAGADHQAVAGRAVGADHQVLRAQDGIIGDAHLVAHGAAIADDKIRSIGPECTEAAQRHDLVAPAVAHDVRNPIVGQVGQYSALVDGDRVGTDRGVVVQSQRAAVVNQHRADKAVRALQDRIEESTETAELPGACDVPGKNHCAQARSVHHEIRRQRDRIADDIRANAGLIDTGVGAREHQVGATQAVCGAVGAEEFKDGIREIATAAAQVIGRCIRDAAAAIKPDHVAVAPADRRGSQAEPGVGVAPRAIHGIGPGEVGHREAAILR